MMHPQFHIEDDTRYTKHIHTKGT